MKREDLPKLIKSTPESIAVEVGVHHAVYAKEFMKNWNGTLFLVDSYLGEHKTYFPNVKKTISREQDYQVALEQMKEFGDRAVFLKEESVNASTEFMPKTLDLVYIDGAHDILNVVRDFSVWYPKVKEGGIIAGHDFYYYHHQVIAAIHLLSNLYGTSIAKTNEECASWYMIK